MLYFTIFDSIATHFTHRTQLMRDALEQQANNEKTPPRLKSIRSLLTGPWSNPTSPRPSDEEPAASSPHEATGFSVLNRGATIRTQDGAPETISRHFNDLSWLDRRRNVHAASEIDYALSHPAATTPTPPVGAEYDSPHLLTSLHISGSEFPALFPATLHLLIHAILLFACIFSLTSMYTRAPLGSFIFFLVWVVLFYLLILIFAWRGHPNPSILATIFTRVRSTPSLKEAQGATPTQPPPSSTAVSQGPYIHQPAYRRAPRRSSVDADTLARMSHSNPMSVNSHEVDDDDDDDDEDDDERQHRMEQEMARRDVSIGQLLCSRL